MTQFITDPPIAQEAKAQRNQQRRNNRKSYQDGAVSDGAIMNSASPRPKNHPKQRQSVAAGQTQQYSQENNIGRNNAGRARPISYAGVNNGTPMKEQAYAGPTFQASPAASALPMPKFSKSVPNAGARGSLSARLASESISEKTPEQTDQSSPETDTAAPALPAREESPLDFFFRADREEKSRSGSQTLSPATANRSQALATGLRNPFQQQSSRRVFLHELDGDSDDLPSPRTVPQQGRPQLGHRTSSSPGVITTHQTKSDSEQRQANTQKLRNLLFQTAGPPPASTPPSNSKAQPHYQHPPAFYGSPSPVQRSSSGPTTPQYTAEQQQQRDQYSLHYGNRNLSPLFKAARDTPPRASSLRQEVASDTSSNPGGGVSLNCHNSPYTSAHDYYNQTARTAGQAQAPQQPPEGASFSGMSIFPKHETNAAVPSEPRGHELTAMENDLRKLLRLNVLG